MAYEALFLTPNLPSTLQSTAAASRNAGHPHVVFNNLITRFGIVATTVGGDVLTSVGNYVQALRDAATYLSRYGIYTTDIDRLLSVHFAQADNALPGGSPHSAIDAAAPASGVPLVWGRSFAPTISRRFDLGIMGRGWSHPWDLRLSRDPETDQVLIRTPGGTRRFSEQPDGSCAGPNSDRIFCRIDAVWISAC